jgi:NADPH2:quinone reductase
MRAIELTSYTGFRALRLVETTKPKAGPGQVLIEVKASGINFAELELTHGRYPTGQTPPFIMGFEAAGTVAEIGPGVANVRTGDPVAAIVNSGGYAEFTVADAAACIPIPPGVSFSEATTIPIQGLSAYALLELAARPRTTDTLLIQAAAGGVGLYLVQLAKAAFGVKTVVALASSPQKLDLVRSLGADVAIDYAQPDWPIQVRRALGADFSKGVDIVLESVSGEAGRESFKLLAPFGRMILFGARNIHDTLVSDQLRQLITANQTITGFNIPSVPRDLLVPLVPKLLGHIAGGKVRIFAGQSYPFAKVTAAFDALASRNTIGKVVLTPQ